MRQWPTCSWMNLGVETGGNVACRTDSWREVAVDVRVINSISSWSRHEGLVRIMRRLRCEISLEVPWQFVADCIVSEGPNVIRSLWSSILGDEQQVSAIFGPYVESTVELLRDELLLPSDT